MTAILKTPLCRAHHDLGAKMADFGGWELPIEYSQGVLAEHHHVRNDVGIFDVSHMGNLLVAGPGVVAACNRILTNDLDRIGPGQAQYTMLCNAEGGVIDDLIAYRISDERVRLIPNAGNADRVAQVLLEVLPTETVLVDQRHVEAIVAVQGPNSAGVLNRVGMDVSNLGFMSFANVDWRGQPVVVARTGYTGELGFEIVVAAELAVELWAAVLQAGAAPCGLGARDTLRLEMGYRLHGQDLSESISPVESGLSWAVGWSKPQFAGREALVAQRAAGRPRAGRGLLMSGRGIAREGMSVLNADGEHVGVVTSGTFSPTLKSGIALALVDPTLTIGDPVAVDVRGRPVAARIVKLPFVDSSPTQNLRNQQP